MAKSYGAGLNNEWSSRTTEQSNNVKKSNLGISGNKGTDKDNGARKTQEAPTTDTPSAMISSNAPSAQSNVVVGSSPSNVNQVESNFDDEVDNEVSSKFDEYLAQQAKAEAQQKAAIQAAVDQSVNSLNAQKTTTAQDYADAYRQLYLNNMKGQKNIGQQMAAQGVTGGASESTLLGMNTNYEDNLRQGKVAEQNALSELEQAIINAQLSGSIEQANAAATNAQNTANAYLTAWQQEIANQQAKEQLQASQNSENRSYAYQIALSMLQNGSMPSDDLLNTAGISKADAQTIVAQYVASKAGKASSPVASPVEEPSLPTGSGSSVIGAGTNNEWSTGNTATGYNTVYSTVVSKLANPSKYTTAEIKNDINSARSKQIINDAQKKYLLSLVK